MVVITMQPVVEVKREKKIYKLSNEEFIRGEWLKIIEEKEPKPTKFDVQYKNGFLSILFYYKSEKDNKEGGVKNGKRDGNRD